MGSPSKRIEDNNPHNHIGQKSNNDWRVEYATYPKSDYKTARGWHIYNVFNDPEFRDELESCLNGGVESWNKGAWKNYDALAKKYCLTSEELTFFQNGFWQSLGNIHKDFAGVVEYSEKRNCFIITTSPNITRRQLNDLYLYIKILRDLNDIRMEKRHRPPEFPNLIYAIFKARMRKLTFNEIFELYRVGELPYFLIKSPTQFHSYYSLERHYNKYRPDR